MPEQRLIYLSSFEYPSRHAHPLHALSMARAFAHLLGDQFLFVISKGVRDPLLHGVPHASPFRQSSMLRTFYLRMVGYASWLAYFLYKNRSWRRNLVLFTNDLKLALMVGFLRPLFSFQLVVEVHGMLSPFLMRRICAQADRIVCVTQGLYELLPNDAAREKAVVLPNAVALEAYAAPPALLEDALALASNAFVITYVGRFWPLKLDKGITFLIDTLALLPPDCHLLLVGGTEEECASARALCVRAGVQERVTIIGHVPMALVPAYLARADVLTYVPAEGNRFLEKETSPMKLFEYQAARKPIVVSDFPTFREALGEDTAYYIVPGDTAQFVRAIEAIRGDQEEALLRVERGFERVSKNTWTSRAARILELV